jgi:hypothetical protein
VRDLARLLKPDLRTSPGTLRPGWHFVAERHRALPDARLAAEVFLPSCRASQIPSAPAEAEDCRKLAASPNTAGWHEAAPTPAVPVRVDSYPYRHGRET